MTIETSAVARASDGDVIAEYNGARGRFRKRIFAWLLANCTMRHERTIARRKRELLGGLTGTIVEIGPGVGANLPYYVQGVRWIGIEPNPHMHSYLKRAAREAGLDAELREGYADHLNFADCSVDTVVSTLVLCSVQNIAGSLAEIRRVLKPGGTFVFLEHVAAAEDSGTRLWQQRIAPVSAFFADGCHPDRETWKAIEAAGFSDVCIEHFLVPLPIIGPHIAGVATK
ncbi:MAG TPA: class I SAM-dependent methyltransferase [Candidatus Acidoferrales bacterium]